MSFVHAHSARDSADATRVMLHASPVPPEPVGTRYLTACGALVSQVTTVQWNPHGPGRHCNQCSKQAAAFRTMGVS